MRRATTGRPVTSGPEPGSGSGTGLGTESGSATIWVLTASGLVLAAGLLVTLLSVAVLTRHRAEAAADLAALAAADAALQGRAAACGRAGRVAAAGGATLVSCVLVNATAEVVVRLPPTGLLGRLPPVSARSRAGPGPVGTELPRSSGRA